MKSYCGRQNGNTKVISSRNSLECRYHDDPQSYFSLGGASSEILGGAGLAKILDASHEYLTKNISQLRENQPISPLGAHTSIGLSPFLQHFISSLEVHLPYSWQGEDDWMVSLQMEGSSAVHAGIDMLTRYQNGMEERCVAVGRSSYHGPPSTSWGGRHTHSKQLTYPVPLEEYREEGESYNLFIQRIHREQMEFLRQHHQDISVIMIEPQWGSSGMAQFWPTRLLADFVDTAHEYNLMVCSDEIMCGLGRHGQGKLFLTDAWGIEVDAVLFGKAIAGGVYPLSGAILRRGRQQFQQHGWGPLQSHTYSHGAHSLSLLTSISLLNQLTHLFPLIQQASLVMEQCFLELKPHQAVRYHGQGLLWGVSIDYSQVKCNRQQLQQQLEQQGVLVYLVEKGILLTPIYNVDIDELSMAMKKLVKVLNKI